MGYDTAINMNELLHTKTWINFANFLSESTQTQVILSI